MKRRGFLLCGGLLLTGQAAAASVGDLKVITQALMDALAPGRADVWAHWAHPDFVFTDENGARLERARFLADFQPLPSYASGTIQVVDFLVQRAAGTAVTTYALEELERFHGADLHARYRETDTWISTAAGWRLLASQIIALRTDPPAIELPLEVWGQYAGRYQLPDGASLEIAAAGSAAELRRASGKAQPLKAELRDLLFVPGEPRLRYLMGRDRDGQVVRLIQRRESWDLIWTRATA